MLSLKNVTYAFLFSLAAVATGVTLKADSAADLQEKHANVVSSDADENYDVSQNDLDGKTFELTAGDDEQDLTDDEADE